MRLPLSRLISRTYARGIPFVCRGFAGFCTCSCRSVPGCTFRGLPGRAPAPPGYQFRENQRVRGRRSLRPWATEIETRPRPSPVSIFIRRCLVLVPCLLIVTSLAEWLPVRSVPEELRITAVWNDMIDHGCLRISWRVLLHAAYAQWVSLQEFLRLSLPAAAVATAMC
jgi:hypothetical protein